MTFLWVAVVRGGWCVDMSCLWFGLGMKMKKRGGVYGFALARDGASGVKLICRMTPQPCTCILMHLIPPPPAAPRHPIDIRIPAGIIASVVVVSPLFCYPSAINHASQETAPRTLCITYGTLTSQTSHLADCRPRPSPIYVVLIFDRIRDRAPRQAMRSSRPDL